MYIFFLVIFNISVFFDIDLILNFLLLFLINFRYYISKRHTIYVTEFDGDNDDCVGDENLTVHPIVVYPDIFLSR